MFELWVPITIAAAFLQNARSAIQKHLKGRLSTTGATFVRFGYGAPVAITYLLILHFAVGLPWPEPNGMFVLYVIIGGVTQILATFLLVYLFGLRNFAAQPIPRPRPFRLQHSVLSSWPIRCPQARASPFSSVLPACC